MSKIAWGSVPATLNAVIDESGESSARTGEILDGRYELVEKIGEGGMGQVYVARHQMLGRRFAVKLVHPELVCSAKLLRRFSREALAASRLESDHVVAVTDCGQAGDGTPYYVMELLRGTDLRQLLRHEGTLPVPRVVSLALDVCRGLRIAHEGGLVHRDLKPANVFLVKHDDGSESAKILDFGVVQLLDENSNSRPGALVGTIKYMPPEQVLAEGSVDARADLYALGAIIYECLSGRPPFVGGNTEEVLFRILNGAIEPLAELRTDLPAGLESVVAQALARSPRDRHASAAVFEERLLPFLGGANHRGRPGSFRSADEPCSTTVTAENGQPSAWIPKQRSELGGRRALRAALAMVVGTIVVLAIGNLYARPSTRALGELRPTSTSWIPSVKQLEMGAKERRSVKGARTTVEWPPLAADFNANAHPIRHPRDGRGSRPRVGGDPVGPRSDFATNRNPQRTAASRPAPGASVGSTPSYPAVFFDDNNPYEISE